MNEQRFLNACRLRDEGRLTEAYSEFIQIAENAADPLDKAGALLYAANTLEMSGQCEAATTKLNGARALMEAYPKAGRDERFAALELFLDFEDANLFWLRAENLEAVLRKFEAWLRKNAQPSNDPRARDFHTGIQTRRAFVLADLGRWKEALPILEGITSPREYKEGIAFYLGHCYASAHEYKKAKPYLVEALRLGLPPHLEYRAHNELGIVYFALGGYAQAKIEFEKTLQSADPAYLKGSEILKRLEISCRQLGLKTEAEHYARRVEHP
jgi:tetratricopeptide (TPR) repeat protein